MIYFIIAVGAAVLLALLIVFLIYSNKKLKVTKYSFNAPENLRIVQLSDLHGASFGKDNEKLIKKVAEQKPEIIVFTGDLIHVYNYKNKHAALHLAAELAHIAPLYFVSGNHEMRNKGYRQFRVELTRAGAVILDNRTVRIKGMTLSGLDCASLRNDRIYSVVPREFGYKILLAHEPQFVKHYVAAGVDLALCGHTHGGQWRIPFTNIGIYAPGQGLFPRYCSGKYKKGKTNIVVSRGLGNSEFPLRLFNRPEICVIDLHVRSNIR